MPSPYDRRVSLTSLAFALTGLAACSLAGLDDYAKGQGATTVGPGASGGGTTASGGAGGSSPAGGASASGGSTAAVGASHAGGAGGGGAGAGGCAGADLDTDPKHCGACDVACAAGYDCLGGVCGNAVVGLSVHFQACALLRAGEVWCWGGNSWGEVGLAAAKSSSTCPFSSTKCQTTPVKVPGIADAVEVTVNRNVSCARTVGGGVLCWGGNGTGRLGHDPTTDAVCVSGNGQAAQGSCSATPVKVALPAGEHALQVVAANSAVCARTDEHDVYCWGMNADGEVQAPPGTWTWQPTKNANVAADAESLAVGSCLGGVATLCTTRPATANVRCWGNSFGGDLFAPSQPAPTCYAQDVCDPAAHDILDANAAHVTADRVEIGDMVACALRYGKVRCWGNDKYAQSGRGGLAADGRFLAPELAGLPMVQGFSSRFLSTLALDTTGAVWGVGWDDEGQLGQGSYASAACPGVADQHCRSAVVQVPGLADVALVATGPNSSGAVTKSGKVYMWGANYTGALAHAPGTAGDAACQSDPNLPCNATPSLVEGLP
jgi:alpha-tubulin suppressor-like RCC1 family protein